jgi:putative phosphoribosyl transferase
MGAIGEDGARVVNEDVLRSTRVTPAEFEAVEKRERAELERRVRRFRHARPRVDLRGRTAVVVDDGIATGSTARAACHVARAHGAAKVVLAVPVAPVATAGRGFEGADEVVVYATPEPFFGVGQFYADLRPTTDEDVVALLAARLREETGAPGHGVGDDPPLRSEDVEIAVGPITLAGFLHVPEHPRGLVVFAHGSGSSRHSSRNRYVADVLNQAGIATLLFDLLTAREERHRANVFDVELLARRLVDVTAWVRAQREVDGLPLGYFGASTGAAAALWAATAPEADIAAIVSRGGRPDLAGQRLGSVRAPTRLIVGGADNVVLDLNREARQRLRCESDLCVVPGATHLFEEPGTLHQAAELARDWFARHFARPASAAAGPDRPRSTASQRRA